MSSGKRIIITILLMSMFSLASCGTTKVTYEQGFPTQESPALTNLMGHYFFEKDNLLNSSEDRYVYAEENGSYEDKGKSINYSGGREHEI